MKRHIGSTAGCLRSATFRTSRAQLDGFKSITAMSDEMRDVIETEWPDVSAKLLSPNDAP